MYRPPDAPGQRRHPAAFLYILLVFFAGVFCLTLSDYGPIWDTWEYYVGDRNLSFYRTLDPAYLEYARPAPVDFYRVPGHPDFARAASLVPNPALHLPSHIWPLGVTSASLSKEIFFARLGLVDPIDAHHLVLLFYVAALLVVLHRFAWRRHGPWAAAVACLCLLIYPRFWGELHNNIKDVPSAVLQTLVILLFVEGVETRRRRTILLAAGLWGAALATKANALMVPLILLPWWLATRIERARASGPPASSIGAALTAAPLVGAAVCAVAWPWLWLDFPEHLWLHLEFLMSKAADVESGWKVMPLVNTVITMPLGVMALIALGLAAMIRHAWTTHRLVGEHLLLGAWVLLPVLRACLPGARDYDVIRHWIEIVPALALIAGIGVQGLLERLGAIPGLHEALSRSRSRAAIACGTMLITLGPAVHWNVTRHPHQIVFYNRLIGGLAGAQARGLPDATDYWVSSYRQGLRWINEHAAPGSLLLVGVAEQAVLFVADLRVRADVHVQPTQRLAPDTLRRMIDGHPAPVYVMYVTRTDWYPWYVTEFLEIAPRVHAIEVDGAPILEIRELGRRSLDGARRNLTGPAGVEAAGDAVPISNEIEAHGAGSGFRGGWPARLGGLRGQPLDRRSTKIAGRLAQRGEVAAD